MVFSTYTLHVSTIIHDYLVSALLLFCYVFFISYTLKINIRLYGILDTADPLFDIPPCTRWEANEQPSIV